MIVKNSSEQKDFLRFFLYIFLMQFYLIFLQYTISSLSVISRPMIIIPVCLHFFFFFFFYINIMTYYVKHTSVWIMVTQMF